MVALAPCVIRPIRDCITICVKPGCIFHIEFFYNPWLTESFQLTDLWGAAHKWVKSRGATQKRVLYGFWPQSQLTRTLPHGRTDGQTDGLNQSYSCLVAAKNTYIHQLLERMAITFTEHPNWWNPVGVLQIKSSFWITLAVDKLLNRCFKYREGWFDLNMFHKKNIHILYMHYISIRNYTIIATTEDIHLINDARMVDMHASSNK